MTSAPIVRAASRSEENAFVDVITLAFSSDPMARWSLSDPRKYLEVMPSLVRAFGGRAFDVDGADCVGDYFGTAMWLPPGVEPDTDALDRIMKEHVDPALLPDIDGVFEQMAAYHPTDPHWYLPLIGIDPARQGHGYGSALMRHALERCDRDGAPAYLESSNPRNIPLYLRHGFEVMGEIQVGSSPTLTPMIRKAR